MKRIALIILSVGLLFNVGATIIHADNNPVKHFDLGRFGLGDDQLDEINEWAVTHGKYRYIDGTLKVIHGRQHLVVYAERIK